MGLCSRHSNMVSLAPDTTCQICLLVIRTCAFTRPRCSNVLGSILQLFARLWLHLRSGGKPLNKRQVSILEKSAFGEQGWAGTGKGSSPQTAAESDGSTHGGDRATDSPAAGEEAARVCCTRGKSLRGYERKPSMLQVHNRGEFSENVSFLVPFKK